MPRRWQLLWYMPGLGTPPRSVVSQAKKSTLPQVSQNFKVEWLTAPLLEAAFD